MIFLIFSMVNHSELLKEANQSTAAGPPPPAALVVLSACSSSSGLGGKPKPQTRCDGIGICRYHDLSMSLYVNVMILWYVDMMIQNRDNDFWLNMKNQFHFVCSVYMYVLCVAEVVIIPYHRSRRQHMAVSSWFVYAPVCDCVVCSFVQFSNDVIDDEYWCWYWWWWWW